VTSLFRRLIGDKFDELPLQLRAIHGGAALRTYAGHCRIDRGGSFISRLCGAVSSLPAAGDAVPLRVSIESDARGETWIRDFAGRKMRSTLRGRDGLLEERMGPTVFRFALDAHGDAIEWNLVGVRSLGIPLPLAWFDKVSARESIEGDRYRFDVRAELPLAGLLVRYRGTLDFLR
jgi:Domain of unknown function (DUF4166)